MADNEQVNRRHACCDDIIAVSVWRESHEKDFLDYQRDAQRWRDEHEKRNNDSLVEMTNRIDAYQRDTRAQLSRIEEKLTTYVNPIIATIISILMALVGLLGGALFALLRSP